MATSVAEAWQAAQVVEKQLQAKLGEKDPTFQEIDHLLAQYRTACENVLFLDFEFASSKKVEARLWDVHSRINNRFRSNLARFQGEEGKKKIVEKRKFIKHYLDFIKSSQRFYRPYVQKLSMHFGGIPELDKVAHKFKWNERSPNAQVEFTPALRSLILASCYQTLVRLGDLSRYRESELTVKDRNWGPAIGYYELACSIYPNTGTAHNQLAVIALVDGNHLRATYHLYRALAVEEPYPSAKGNLEIQFKKIVVAWRKGELIVKDPARDGNAGKALSAWFVLLHARCYKGEEFAEHDELENEFLSRLTIDLKERSLSHFLNRFILINIAAEYFAGIRVQDAPESKENYQAFFFFLRLNVKTFVSLLQILQTEVERLDTNDNRTHGNDGNNTTTTRLTPAARRVLPGLRNYSSWLVSNSALLVARVGDECLNVQIKEMWRIYANSLTLLAATFPAAELPLNEYLLEEDVDTLGFKPFTVERVRGRYRTDSGQRKPRYHDAGVNRNNEDTEMLGRIRDILTDGLDLVVNQNIPIALVNGMVFSYQQEGVPSELLVRPNGTAEPTVDQGASVEKQTQAIDVNGGRYVDISQGNTGHNQNATVVDDEDTTSQSMDNSEPASLSMSAAMNHMVDSLVGPDESSMHNHSTTADPSLSIMPPPPPSTTRVATPPINRLSQLTADETTFYPGAPGTLTAAELVNMVHNYSAQKKPQPTQPSPAIGPSSHQSTPRQSSPLILPSIWNTPFAPQATDLGLSFFTATTTTPSTSRPGTANRSPDHRQAASKRTSLNQVSTSSSGSNPTIPSMLFPDPSSSSWFTPSRPTPPPPPPPGGGRQQLGMGNGNDASNTTTTSYEAIMAMEPLWSQTQWATREAGRYGIGMGIGMGGTVRGNTNNRGMMTGFNHGNNETPPPGQGG